MTRFAGSTASLAIVVAFFSAGIARAQEANLVAPAANPENTGVENRGIADIIVTAQKRSESANTVPMSITASSGDELQSRGVTSVEGLVKVVPGFNAIDSGYGTPVYFLRGVGFFDVSLTAKPTVSIYIDEAPFPYLAMSSGVAFDLARVEVLKGPQGTLFGQNATGGAINYVAAKPTSTLDAGIDASYGRFNTVDLSGFISGPLNSTMKARLAVRMTRSNDWQQSTTRDDSLGEKNFLQGRFILDWEPTDRLKISTTLSGFIDKSDTQAPQLVTPFQQSPTVPLFAGLANYPATPRDDRSADWSPDSYPLRSNNRSAKATLRMDYDISDEVSITSLTSYDYYKRHDGKDADGTRYHLVDLDLRGHIESINQELRIGGKLFGSGSWLLGGNYEHDSSSESQLQSGYDQSTFKSFVRFGLPPVDTNKYIFASKFESKAIFGNVTIPLTEQFSVNAGVRYTETDQKFSSCILNNGNGTLGRGLEIIFGLPTGTIPLGSCATQGNDGQFRLVRNSLGEDNVSWRAGVEWKPAERQLIYANVSRGFKSGAFPSIPATQARQLDPVGQEKVTAYEVGIKSSLFDRRLQLNGALFYYDYVDKQLIGRTIVPIFGPIDALVNVPKSRIKGAEIQATMAPMPGLRINAGGTYLDTRVTRTFTNYSAFGAVVDFNGTHFPFTPKWQINGDAEYKWALTESLGAFAGSSLTYRSSTNGDFTPDARLAIKSYALLDLRAGIASADDRWRVGLFGRNVTNTFYYQVAARRGDVVIRYAGMPVTYGLNLSYRFR